MSEILCKPSLGTFSEFWGYGYGGVLGISNSYVAVITLKINPKSYNSDLSYRWCTEKYYLAHSRRSDQLW